MKSIIFIKNTVILTAVSLLLRSVGLIFKIWLSSKIGAEGIGLYQLIASVYVLASAFASTGICTGVTKLVSEERALTVKTASAILLKAAGLTVVGSLIIGGGLFLLSEPIAATLLGDARAALSLRILCFSLPFKGIAASLKGYFYARRKSGAPAASQLFEQAVRITVIILLVGRFSGMGLKMLVAAVLIGDTVSEAASFVYIYIAFIRDRRTLGRGENSKTRICSSILRVALPITGSRYITSGLHTAESLIVPGQLAIYTLSSSEALSQYGMLKGMTLPLIFFPAAFLGAASVMLMPEAAEAAAAGKTDKIRELAEKTVGITSVLSVLLASIFFACSRQLGAVLFNSSEVGYMIRVLSPIVPFMYLESVSDGMLKGLGQQNRSFIYNVCDSSIRIILILLLVKKFGMNAFLVIMLISNFTTSTLNTGRLMRVAGAELNIGEWIIKPLVAAFTGMAAAGAVTGLCGGAEVLSLAVGAMVQTAVFAAVMPILSTKSREYLYCIKEILIKRKSRRKNLKSY